jgi:hypothetical protein
LNLFRFPASAGTSLPLRRQGSFEFRVSPKGLSCQQKRQANPRPQRPITTLYYTFSPESLIKKCPNSTVKRPFCPPKKTPITPQKSLSFRLNPSGAPKDPTGKLENFTEEPTGTLQNFPQNPPDAPENPCPTPESFPRNPAEPSENPRSRPRNPHLSRKDSRKKISILNFGRQKFNKGQRPKSYEKIPPLTQPRLERQGPLWPNNLPILPASDQGFFGSKNATFAYNQPFVFAVDEAGTL